MRQLLPIIALTMAATAGTAAAQDCGSIKDDKARLACYDKGTSPSASEPSKTTPSQSAASAPVHFAPGTREVGSWVVKIEDDNFDNQEKVVAIKAVSDGVFAVRCFSGSPSLSFSLSGGGLSSGDAFTFKLRIDSGKIYDAVGDALGDSVVESGVPDGLLQDILDGNTLHVRITNAGGTSEDKSFSLAGSTAALKELKQVCPPSAPAADNTSQ